MTGEPVGGHETAERWFVVAVNDVNNLVQHRFDLAMRDTEVECVIIAIGTEPTPGTYFVIERRFVAVDEHGTPVQWPKVSKAVPDPSPPTDEHTGAVLLGDGTVTL